MAPRSALIFLHLTAAVVGALPLHLHQSSASLKAESCTCQNWKQTYASKKAQCGQSNEFFLATGLHAPSPKVRSELGQKLGGEFCTRFFETLNTNVCVNVNMGNFGKDCGTWCYVSADCADATAVPSSAVSWKQCSATDLRLRDLAPTTLAIFARDHDLDLGLLHKMSYPLYGQHLWGDVEAFWGLGGKSASSLPADLRKEMQEIADSGTPHSFDTAEDNHPPHRIVVGMTVYAVYPSAHGSSNHPGTWNELSCVTGCEQ